MVSDAQHPCGDGGPSLIAISLAPDFQKHLIHQLFGRGLSARYSHQEPVKAHMVTGIEALHRETVAPRDAFDQVFVRSSAHDG
jgi:hypothetical protein